MCPFGHAASLVKVTERKFQSLDKNRARTHRRAASALLHRHPRAGEALPQVRSRPRRPQFSVRRGRDRHANHTGSVSARAWARASWRRSAPTDLRRRRHAANGVLADGAWSVGRQASGLPFRDRRHRHRRTTGDVLGADAVRRRRSPIGTSTPEIRRAYNAAEIAPPHGESGRRDTQLRAAGAGRRRRHAVAHRQHDVWRPVCSANGKSADPRRISIRRRRRRPSACRQLQKLLGRPEADRGHVPRRCTRPRLR